MKRWLTLWLCVLFLPLAASADAPDMTFILAVGQNLETGIFADQGTYEFYASAVLPVWLEVETLTYDGWRLAILAGEAVAAGEWNFTVTVREHAPGDKKGRDVEKIDVRVIVTPDESGAAYHRDTNYRGDGQYMLTLAADAPACRLPGAGEMGVMPAGTRLVACNSFAAMPDMIWCAAYSNEFGYCWLPGYAVNLEDRPPTWLFTPGGTMRLPLFLADDPSQVQVELTRDPEDEAIAQLERVEATRQSSGEYLLTLVFSFRTAIPHPGRDVLTATLYDASGHPLEVATLVFEASQ